jgi:hypothetical protein
MQIILISSHDLKLWTERGAIRSKVSYLRNDKANLRGSAG